MLGVSVTDQQNMPHEQLENFVFLKDALKSQQLRGQLEMTKIRRSHWMEN
jgi:hypothetical protein